MSSGRGQDLTGATAVVSGASGNLGPVWCRALLDSGCSLVALDHPEADPTVVEHLSREHPDRVRTVAADVRDAEALSSGLDEVLRGWEPPSILVNNAGIDSPPGPATTYRTEDFPADLFDQVLSVNVVGLFTVTQTVVRRMERGGSIINIGSLYASVSPNPVLYDHLDNDPPFLKPPAYGASKGAVVNLSRYLAVHLASRGIRVNTLSPGGVLGGQDPEFRRKFVERVPLGRMAEETDLVGPLLFLASSESSYVTAQELVVDGGFTAL